MAVAREYAKRIRRMPANFRAAPSVKKKSGVEVRYHVPEIDWNMVRAVKARCEAFCPRFDNLHGGCKHFLMPGISCGGVASDRPQ